MQDHNAMVMVQHSTPRSAPAVEGCVMSHDKRTCLEASTWQCTIPFKLVGAVCTLGLWMLLLMYGYSPSSLRSLLCFPTGSPHFMIPFFAWTVCSYVPSRRVVRATARDPPLRSTNGEGGVVDRVCHVSLRTGMCLPGKLSDVTHSMSTTHKKMSDYTRHE